MPASDFLVWVDLETTGLEPEGGSILEMAVLITRGNLQIVDTFSYIFDLPKDPSVMDDYVTEMHSKSGLLEDCDKGPTWRWKEATENFLERVNKFSEPKTVPLVGSTVHFDRLWLKMHVPEIEKWFHYRNLDVSTFQEAFERWLPDIAAKSPEPQKVHRAMADIRESLAKARYYRDFVLTKAPRSAGW